MDVTDFLHYEFQKEGVVDARRGMSWQRGVLVQVPDGKTSRWRVRCQETSEEFDTDHVRQVADTFDQLIRAIGCNVLQQVHQMAKEKEQVNEDIRRLSHLVPECGTTVPELVQSQGIQKAIDFFFDQMTPTPFFTDLYVKLRELKALEDQKQALNCAEGDAVEGVGQVALQQMLRDIINLHCPAADVGALALGRLPSGTPSMSLRLQTRDIRATHRLRDVVLSSELEAAMNAELSKNLPEHRRWQLQVVKTEFFKMYERSLLSLSELTPHQRERLQEMEAQDQDIHLSAPAGAGKTFVAVQHVLNTLQQAPEGNILYVAPCASLCFYFLRWLATRHAGHLTPEPWRSSVQQLLSRVHVLHNPFGDESSLLTPQLQNNQLVLVPNMVEMPLYSLVVVDEAHDVFRQDADSHVVDKLVGTATRKILLSDLSQSSVLVHAFPDLYQVSLTEVVTC